MENQGQAMKVQEIMSQPVVTCRPNDSLNRAAELMWDGDCGTVPVVDDDGRVAGIVTDRDICMASYTKGQTLASIPVSEAMTSAVRTCRAEDPVESAVRQIREARARRLPVVDDDNRPVGILSLNDIARSAADQRQSDIDREVVEMLAAVCEPRRASEKSAVAAAAPRKSARRRS